MIRHTPGPWTYEAVSQTVYGESAGGCDKTVEPFMIANVRGWGHLQYLPNGAEIQDANGRLIAAAPDLLEALMYAENLLIEYLEEFGTSGQINQIEESGTVDELAPIYAAIAKAKGGTP